ncbi:MAG: efflux RND transporter permease subunit [Flavobacteriales bacterium]|nr:efflux RND transporter permease subunit [Flavobacteriales bacterium]
MSITEISIKRPLLILVIFFTLILFGFMSFKSLNYNLLPELETNMISVATVYRGASADEVETSVTKFVEDAVSSIEGVKHIRSNSMEGVSTIIIELKDGTNTVTAQLDAERKINQIRSSLPDDIDDPVVNRVNPEELPVLRLSASANVEPTELYDLVDQQIKPILSNVSGVGSVNLIGGNKREIKVEFNNDKLTTYGMTATQINQVIASSNISYPVGNVDNSELRMSLRLDEKFKSVDDLRNLIIRQTNDGSRVYLKDVATITDAQEKEEKINRVNGKPGVGIEVVKQADANTVDVSNTVKEKLEELKERYASKGLDFEIAVDQSLYTLASADAVMHDLVLAIFIVAFVMLLFLHSVKSSFFVLVALPSAMIPTFLMMYIFGFSLNLMTLMALSLVVGILVDDSIVILENIFRHMEMGKKRKQAAIEGRAEIGFTAVAITLVDIVVFVPMAIAGGMIGNILREFSLVVVFSTLMSLLVSFTLTPLLASRFASLPKLSTDKWTGKFFLWFERQIDKLKEGYGKILNWSLNHKRWIIMGILTLFVGAISLVPTGFIGTAFVSESDKGELNVSLELAAGSSLKETNITIMKAEEIALSHPEVEKVFTSVGSQSGSLATGNTSTSNLGELAIMMVPLEDRSISQEEFGVQLRNELSEIPGLKVTIKPTGITGSSEAPVQVAVRGTNLKTVNEVAQEVKDIVAATSGTDYVEFSTKSPQTEIDIQLDKDKMNMVGLSMTDVGSGLQMAFRGNDQLNYTENGEEYSINMIADEGSRQTADDVRNIVIRNASGAQVRLKEIATIGERMGQSVLQRYDRLNSVTVQAFVTGRPVGTVTQEIQDQIEKLKIPEGVQIGYLGQAERQKDAFGSLGVAMIIGFLLVYLIMVALYESMVYPFVVMFSIPVALIGALLALALSMETMTIFAIVGLIMLMGLVAKNGILIVDFANHLKAEGMELKEALLEAGKERLRPILMTTIAMIFGMLPIAISSGAGAEVKNGMAWVIIGGLTSSLLLTLILVPTIYYIVDKLKERFSRFSKRFKKDSKESDMELITGTSEN